MKGLAVNGMNGGQTGSPPISIEALEEVNVLLTPYDAQYGNFTGGSINAITRSGSNEFKASVWYYFRNEYMAGRSPEYIGKPNSPGEFYRPRLTEFFNNTFGNWTSGAIVKNKLFYFALLERQTESRPQPFNFDTYRGNSNHQQLTLLSDFLKSNYQYDPGSYLLSRDDLNATRMNLKLDWNASFSNKFMLSYRFNDAERTTAPRPSSTNAISFQNNGVILPARTNSLSFEWKHALKRQATNRLLFTYTNQVDYRNWIGQPFPNVVILDGNGTLSFGSESSSGPNYFKGNELNFLDAITFARKKQVLAIGTDIDLTAIKWAGLPALFGVYQF
ncbi:MAG TPA: hypothetical protein VJ508_06130, partial [Saprospiraceae bacterium]|nr:hypothetical protein [Saprospiraceae bacterium]